MSARAMWIYPSVIMGIWLAWAVFWLVSARGAKVTARVESTQSRLMYLLPLLAGVLLVEQPPLASWRVLSVRALPWSATTYWCGVALQAAGLLFTVWARIHVGRNWSAVVTLQEGRAATPRDPQCTPAHRAPACRWHSPAGG